MRFMKALSIHPTYSLSPLMEVTLKQLDADKQKRRGKEKKEEDKTGEGREERG
jgi:hypothetical protein